ncbi:MAG TPA: DUF192 domain-containing protein [Gaiellaceae bacterium]|nr:DUF192 domain-containing protein [Gaiellaceae bacterium]
MRVVELRDETGAVVCARCSLATNPWTRLRGLLGRSGLDDDEGLLIRPTSSIHMFGMRFPIDAVFLDRELVVMRVVAGLEPWRTASQRRAKAVLELPAGAAGRAGIREGSRLSLGSGPRD